MKNKHRGSSFKSYLKELEKETFANRLYRERISQNMSQKELADLVGLSRQTINMYENARKEPSLFNAIKIADCVGFYLLDLKSSLV